MESRLNLDVLLIILSYLSGGVPVSYLIAKYKKNIDPNADISSVHLEKQSYEENASRTKQPILPFSNKRVTRDTDDIFKLPDGKLTTMYHYQKNMEL